MTEHNTPDTAIKRAEIIKKITTCTQQQDYKKALEYADEAIQNFPNDTAIAVRRAVLLRQVHRTEESIQELDRLHAQYPENWNISFELAICHKENGNNKDCLCLLEKVLAVKPDHRGALLLRITVCSQEQDFKQALEYADTAIKILPDDTMIALKRAVLLRQTHRDAESIQELEKIHSLHPENPQITFELAISHKLNGNNAACINLLKKVLADKQDHRGALLQIIITYSQMQNFKLALEYADQAIKILPNDQVIALRRAVLLRQTLRVDESIFELKKLYSLYPENTQITFELAVSHKEYGNDAACLELLEEVLAATPDHRGALLQIIITYSQMQNFKLALEYAEQAIKFLPNDPVIALRRAVLLRQTLRVDKSILELKKLYSLYPENTQITFELAISHKLNGNNAACLELLEQVIAAKPDHRGALLHRIAVCSQEQNFKLALEYADNAIKILPDDLNVALKRAVLLRQTNRIAESSHELEKLHSLHPENPQITFELAISHKSNGNNAACINLLKKVLADKPDHRGALLQIIITYSQMQNFKLALEYADQAIKFLPDDTVIALKKALLLRQTLRVDESIHELKKIHSLNPENPQITFELAISHKSNGNNAACINLLKKVLADKPNHRGALLQIIITYSQMQNYILALEYADQAIKFLPDDTVIALKKAVLLRQLNRVEESIKFLEKAVTSYPDQVLLKEQLAVSYLIADDYFKSNQLMTEFLTASTADKTTRLRQIDRHLVRAEFQIAVELCEELIQRFPDDLGVQLVYADALSQSHRHKETADILNFLEINGFEGARFATVKMMDMLATKNPDTAFNWLKKYGKHSLSHQQTLSKILSLLIFYNRIDDSVDLIAESSENHYSLWSGQFFTLITQLLANGRKNEAEMVLKHCIIPEDSVVPQILPWILKALGRDEEARDTALRSIKNTQNDPIEISKHLSILDSLDVETKDIEARLINKKKFTDSEIITIGDYLLKSLNGEMSPLQQADRQKLEAAWSFADHSAYVYEEWAAKVIKSTNFSLLSCKAFDDTPEAMDALSDRIEFPDLTVLTERYQQKKSFLIATSHFGSPWSLWCLMKHFPKLHYLAAYSYPVSNNPFTKNSLSNEGDIKSIRKMATLLKEGGALAAAADFLPDTASLMPVQKPAIARLCGKKIQFPNLLPRLAWRYNIPIYWLQAKPGKGKIVYEFEPFPKPLPDENKEVWCDRWAESFASKLERIISGPPESLSLNVSTWRLLANNNG
ncbi:tetratricopeptide repeat protein [Maridesulfovibrio bastinii]|uniref:tetratricopeptide repeat protein n=1 Tax=Maridesulfovibrio bastinii TaxID=47157 RepID=UPI00041C8D22|nr:tetratricopeptide repeat protein [Maridesulfovibrio bastinii]